MDFFWRFCYKGRVQLDDMDVQQHVNDQGFDPMRYSKLTSTLGMLAVIAIIAITFILGPSDRSLGGNLRLILLHGSWVWTGMILFAASALTGLAALITRRTFLHDGSLALGRTGLIFWLTYLPMSLVVMQMNWGGYYFDEPRWRIPFSFAVVGLLLQVGLLLFNQRNIASAANLLFGGTLWYSLRSAGTVLHPEAPVAQSGLSIQFYFYFLLALAILFGIQIFLFSLPAILTTKLIVIKE
jgi:hypothetical protein